MAARSLARVLARPWSGTSSSWFHRAAAGAVVGAGALCTGGPTARCSRDDGHGHGLGHVHVHSEDGHKHNSMPSKFAHQHGTERSHLIFGVPKKGRLYEQIKKILEGAGIDYVRKDRIDIATCHNLPISIVFLPAKDIATYVGEGDVDLGITGEDCVAESESEVKVLMQLGIGKCNLSVQAPKDAHMTAADLAGKRIVTSFPTITAKYFRELEAQGNPTHIKCISGSVEAACGLGLADGIVDLVETGTTMRAAGLEEVATIMRSQAVLIMNPHSKHPELCELVRRRIAGYLTAQRWVMVTYNVHRFNLKSAEKITPGKTSPSIQPLEDKNWVAVAALVPKAEAAQVMDDLESVGARDILLTSLLSTRLSS